MIKQKYLYYKFNLLKVNSLFYIQIIVKHKVSIGFGYFYKENS